MIIKCKMCGGDLRPAENATTCECEYCGSVQTIPKLDNERRLNLYDRANHFRRNNEYDKAMGIFEQILQDDRTDAEAYWSLVLCRYGIEYVEDPATKKRIPTVNRAQFTSIFADDDYKSALEYADSVQKSIYETEAKAIDDIQKGILDISKKEKPFDVFICYKETDSEGKRTPDSVLANDLYHQLTREGFKVFFSRITLEDKLGQQYEPYIFAALNSAKVMVVLGTKPEYFNAVWVKNEWSRYLKLIRSGANKTLVPAYKDMDPYDLPEEFSHLQAQDMSKLGFMQDLIHGIKKIAGEEKPAAAQQPVVVQAATGAGGSNAAALLDRAFMALEDGEWAKADDFCEKALNIDARNARAYIGKLMAELKVRKESDLQYQSQPIERSGNYAKALRFADEKLQATLKGYNEAIKERNEQNRQQGQYNEAMQALNAARTVADVQAVKSRLSAIASYKETTNGLKACDDKIESINSAAYTSANNLMKQKQYVQAAAAFRAIGNYRDCQSVAKKCDELEKQRLAEEAAARAEEQKRLDERRAKEEAERKEKERVAAELKAREDEIKRREAEAKAAKAKKTGIILAIVAALCVAAFFVVTKVVLPKMNYDNAVKALQAGQYDTAITAFTELGDYEDSGHRITQAQANKAFAAGQYDTVGNYYATLPTAYQDHANDFVTMYNDAVALMDGGNYDEAIAAFTKLGNYSDSKTQINEATYRKACALMAAGNRSDAATLFSGLGGYKDSKNLIAQMEADMQYENGNYADAWAAYAALPEAYQTHNADYAEMYTAAETLLTNGSYDDAAAAFNVLGTYSNAADMVKECSYRKAQSLAASGSYDAAIALYDSLNGYSDSKNLSAQAKADKLYAAGSYADAYAVYATLGDAYQTNADGYAALYADALAQQTAGQYDDAVTAFTALGSYSDAADQIKQSKYLKAGSLAADGKYDDAITIYNALGEYSDSKSLASKAKADKLYDAGSYADAYAVYAALGDAYQTHAADYASMYTAAEAARTSGDYDNAYDQFIALGAYSDAKDKAIQCGTDKANALFAAGQYGEAAEVYTFIGDTDKATESTYKYAGQLAEQGEYLLAAKQYETIMTYQDSQEQHYQMGLQARVNGKLADAYAILSVDPDYRDTKEAIYQTGVAASSEKLYEVSVPAFTQVGAYKDAAMKLTMDTYAWGGQLFDNADYDKSAEVFASMGEFSDAPIRANEARYAAAGVSMKNGSYDDAAARYAALGSYSDSADKAKAAAYAAADEQLEAGSYADAKARFTKLGGYSDSKSKAQECDYRPAMALFNNGEYAAAKTAFVALGSYSNSADMAKECDYIPAKALYTAKQYQDALNAFTAGKLSGYSDSDTIMNDCRYQLGKAAMANADYTTARDWFDAAGSYSDSKAQANECRYQLALAQKNEGKYDDAIAAFSAIKDYSDSKAQISACYNAKAAELETKGSYEAAYTQYELAGNTAKMQEMAYQTALVKLSESDYVGAIGWYEKAGTYSDAKEQILSIGEYYYATQQYDAAEVVYVKVLGTGNAAHRLYELGQYYELVGNIEHAAKCYREAGEYEDAHEKAVALQNEVTYQAAESLFLAGNWEGARTEYLKISGYKDVDSKVATCDNEIAAAAKRDAKFAVGNYVTFGSYPQTKAGTDNTPIEWLVIARDGQKALLISRYGLDRQKYNTSKTSVTWETSSIRTWLNGTFINQAFSLAEQGAIVMTNVDNSKSQGYSQWSTNGGNNTQDKVFLLSYAEANKYLGVTDDDSNNTKSRVSPTEYAVKNGAWTSSSNKTAEGKYAGYWWLRSPGSSSSSAASVFTDGSLYNSSVNRANAIVRPALWINLESGIF